MHVEEVSDVQDRMKSAEAIAKEFEWIAKAKLAYRSESLFADRFGVRKPQDALADVRAAVDNWSSFAADAGIPSSLRDRVSKDHLPI